MKNSPCKLGHCVNICATFSRSRTKDRQKGRIFFRTMEESSIARLNFKCAMPFVWAYHTDLATSLFFHRQSYSNVNEVSEINFCATISSAVLSKWRTSSAAWERLARRASFFAGHPPSSLTFFNDLRSLECSKKECQSKFYVDVNG